VRNAEKYSASEAEHAARKKTQALSIYFGPVHTIPEKIKTLPLGQPFILVSHGNEAFRKRSSKRQR